LRQWAKGKDVWLEGSRLRVPGKLGGSIKIKLHRPIEGTPKTASLVLRADGKWYVVVVCEVGDAPPKRKGEAIGLDVGLRFFLTDSKGETVGNPRCYHNRQKKLRRAQRRVCRRRRGSNRRKKAARHAAKQHLKIARQRRDFLHKTARRYVEHYALIAVEDLNVGGLLRNRHVAKAISDASWSEFVRILEQKAESAAVRVVRVPARSTSQRCSGCGETVRKSLSVRRHAYPSCGYVTDRDHNAARNILASARAGPSERNAGGYPERAPRGLRP
jgi:putative transposase